MNTKQKLAYIAIGGLLVATGMIISPLNAQKEKFGEIECTKLSVADEDGTPRVVLVAGDYYDPSTDENAAILIYAADFYRTVSVRSTGKEGERSNRAELEAIGGIVGVNIDGNNGDASVMISSDEFGGRVNIQNNEGEMVGLFGANPDGGSVTIINNDQRTVGKFQASSAGGICNVRGNDGESMAFLSITERGGGLVAVLDKDGDYLAGLGTAELGGFVEARGKDGKSNAKLFIIEQGGGAGVNGKDQKSSVLLGTDELGGWISIRGKGKDEKPMAVLMIDEHGGKLSTRGNGDSKASAIMGINTFGDGTVSRYDKNGYLLK